MKSVIKYCAGLALMFFASVVSAQSGSSCANSLTYNVVAFNDPQNLLSEAEHQGILTNLAAAMAQWALLKDLGIPVR